MNNLNKWFDKGITKEEYMSDLDTHQQSFLHIYENFTIPTEEIKTLQQYSNIRMIALAEAWCGHCMLDVPILLRISEAGNIPISFLRRDENLELMDQYLTNDKRIIPIVIFIDDSGNELAKWGPMAPEIAAYSNKLKQDLPNKEDEAYKEAFQNFIQIVGNTFTNDESFWNAVYTDIVKTLTSIT